MPVSWDLLSECIREIVAEAFLSEKLFGKRFDIRAFRAIEGGFNELDAYVQKAGLPHLHEGSTRKTYMLSAGKVLKLATETTLQNKGEVEAFRKFGRNYVPEVYDFDERFRWIIVEPARTFGDMNNMARGIAALIRETEVGERTLVALSRLLGLRHGNNKPDDLYNSLTKYERGPDFEQLPPKGQELVQKFVFLTQSGMKDIARFDHWGVGADQRLVCIDPGVYHGGKT